MIRGVFVIPFVVLLAVDPLTERAPTLVVRPQDQTVANNGIANFYCSAIGDPKPQIEWRKGRKRLHPTHRFTVIQTPDGGSVLRIKPVLKSRDEARYTCNARNHFGAAHSSIYLTVLDAKNLPFGFPRIVQHPKGAWNGGNAELVCRVMGIPTPRVTWLKNMVPLNTSSPHHSIVEDGLGNMTDFTLRINGIEKSDEGKYECVAENSLGRVQSNVYVITLEPELVVRPQDQTVANNGIANFYCLAIGDPKPQIEWWKGSKRLNTTHRFTVIQTPDGGSVLRIKPVHKSRDEAKYEYIAKNIYRETHGFFYLTVRDDTNLPFGFPRIVQHPRSEIAWTGENAKFECRVTGIPTPIVIWLKDTVPLHPSHSIIEDRLANTTDFTLRINGIEKSNEGKYECVAENSLGRLHSETANLYLREVPNIQIWPAKQSVSNVGVADFFCSATGRPGLQIDWHINSSNGSETVVKTTDGSILRLKLANDTRNEINVECVAANGVGDVGRAVAVLAVHDENKLPVGFPQIVEHPWNKWVTKGYKVVFACQATGNPPPTITWLKNMVPVDVSDRRYALRVQGFLEIVKTEINDEGNYECVAKNSLGAVHSYVAALQVRVLMIRKNPQRRLRFSKYNWAPENVFARPLSRTMVVVSWDQPNEEFVMGYDVYFTSHSDGQYSSDWSEQTVDEGRLTTIAGLKPNTVYTIKVQAIFKDGSSRASSDFVRVKMQLGIPNPPTEFKIMVTLHTSVRLGWVQPAVSEDEIVSYELYWSDILTKEIQNRSIPVWEWLWLYRLDDLLPDTEYDFWVAAKSKYHEGPPTYRVRAWTTNFYPDAPGAPAVSVIDSTAIRVQWEAPNFPTTFIRGYQISVAATDEPEPLEFDNIDAAAQEFNVTGLQPETVYSVTIAARIRYGAGRWSAPEMVTTPGGVPSRPLMSVRVIQEEPSFIVNVEWTKPNVTHGPLLGYRLRYSTTMELGKDEQNKTLHLPQMNTIYQIRLAARNDVGYGGEAVARVETPIRVPTAPPENVTFYFQTPSTLVVSWEPPSTDRSNGPIVSYDAQLHSATDLRWSKEITTSFSNENVMLKAVFVDLEENKEYLLQVRGFTKKGGGPYTERVVIRTPTSPADVPVPSWVKAAPTSKTTAQVWWDNVEHGDNVLGYRVYYKRVYNYKKNEVEWMYVDCNSKGPSELTNLKMEVNYDVVVAARTSNATGKASGKFILEMRPELVAISLQAHVTSTNSATLTWSWSPGRWFDPIGYPREHRISYGATKEYVGQSGIPQKQIIPVQVKTVGSAIRSYTINGLSPFTTYHVQVTAIPADGSYSPPVRIAVTTRMAAPNPMVKPDFNVVNGTVILPSASEEFGPIAHYDLVVVMESTEEELDLGSGSSFDRPFKDPDEYTEADLIWRSKSFIAGAYFIAARFVGRSIPSVFTIGDEKMYGGFKNRNLMSGQRFRVFVRAVVDAPQEYLYTSSPFSDTIVYYRSNVDLAL